MLCVLDKRQKESSRLFLATNAAFKKTSFPGPSMHFFNNKNKDDRGADTLQILEEEDGTDDRLACLEIWSFSRQWVDHFEKKRKKTSVYREE